MNGEGDGSSLNGSNDFFFFNDGDEWVNDIFRQRKEQLELLHLEFHFKIIYRLLSALV